MYCFVFGLVERLCGGGWLLLVAGFGFALPQFAVGKARKPIVYFRIYCPTCLARRTRPTLLLPTSAKHHLCFYGCFQTLEVLLFALFRGKESDSWNVIFSGLLLMCMLDEIRAKRDEIYAIARAHKAEKLWVFGSCARTEEAVAI